MSLPDLDRIEATLHFRDGRTCQVMLSAQGIQRWGASIGTLGDAVDATEAMQTALIDVDAYGTAAAEGEARERELEA